MHPLRFCCAGPCDSATTVATSGRPYFTAQITGMGVLSGTDTAYLSDPATYATRATRSGTPYKEGDAGVSAGAGNTFAYVATTTGVGDGKFTSADGNDIGVGGYFGAAFYLGQTGTISTNTNQFPAPDQESTHRFQTCIGEIADGECGTGITLNPGSLKFSLFGAIGGSNLATVMADKSYIGFSTEIGMYQTGDATVTFNDAVALADLDGADVTSFTITKGDETVSHVFPSTYNVGSTADCTPTANNYACGTSADASFTRSVKIKAIPVEGDSSKVRLDYLFAVAPSSDSVDDGLDAPGRYFVYDPDVVPVSGPTPSPAAGTAATTSTATTGSSGAATVSCAAALYLAIVTVLGSIVGQLA